MKQFKQLASLFLAFALVIGLFSAPTVAYAEDKEPAYKGKVEIDYSQEILTVDRTENQKVYYTTKWTEGSHAKTVWDEAIYYTDYALIDFSWTSPTKDVTFYITDDPINKPTSVVIKAQEKNLAVMFSGVAKTTASSKLKLAHDWSALNEVMGVYESDWAYGYLCAAIKNGQTYTPLTPDEAFDHLQYRKGLTGDWLPILYLDVSEFAANGTQLYFRIAPIVPDREVVSSSSIVLGRASKEVKVKFSKQANAPKVTINGVTKEIKFGKTMEYRVGTITSDGRLVFGDNEWVAVSAKHMDGTKVKTTYLKDLLKSASGSAWDYSEDKAGQVVQVRVAGTEKAIASKIRTIELNKVETPVATSSAVAFELVSKTTYDQGIKVTNNCTTAAIQVAVVSGSPTDLNAKAIKWTTIAAKGDKTKTVTIKGKDLEGKDTILYRFATVKDDSKTPEDEFKVSSKAGEYKFRDKLKLEDQKIQVTGVSKTKGPDTATVSCGAITGGDQITVKSATAGAIEVSVELKGTNIADNSSFSIECVSAMGSTTGASSDKVKLVADGKMGSTGKLKLTLTDDVTTGSTFFKVTANGCTHYIQVTFTK